MFGKYEYLTDRADYKLKNSEPHTIFSKIKS